MIRDFRFMPYDIYLPVDSFQENIEAKRDLQAIKDMYPEKIKIISNAVEEECNRWEYEGSPMLAEYPDKEFVRMIARTVYDRLEIKKDLDFPGEFIGKEYLDNELEYLPKGPGYVNQVIRNIIELLICNEMYCRRDRYRRRRRRFY